MMPINQFIDHTLLKPDAQAHQIVQLCKEAVDYEFASVCIHPHWIGLAKDHLMGSNVKICTVIGFPLGANTIESKAFETQNALSLGATEIDMVLNISKVKDGDFDYIEQEISAVVAAAGSNIVKVILETCLLSEEEIVQSCLAAVRAKAAFVKTSTGFSLRGASVQAVALMKQSVGDAAQVKAAGGVRTHADVIAMLKAGATRIGTSAGVQLASGEENNQGY